MASCSSVATPVPRRCVSQPIDDWIPPAHAVGARRRKDFDRFLHLQAQLKRCCSALLYFTRQDFESLSEVFPDIQGICQSLHDTEPSKLTGSMAKFSKSLEALLQRISEKEKLRIVFIGPVNAGKTTLINMILTACLGECEQILPTSPQAETNCIWKVVSCDGNNATVQLDGNTVMTWHMVGTDAVAIARMRETICTYLDENLSREARAGQHKEATLSLPLGMLNPFGCHYCLVDTPGYTESDAYEALVAKYLRDHSHIACMVSNLTQGKAVVQSTKNMLAKSYSRTFWVLTQYDEMMSKRKRGQEPRTAADKAVKDFREEIREVDADAQVFTHAAEVLQPQEPEWTCAALAYLSKEEASGWLQEIVQHVQGCFLQIQQQNHVLSSQSRHCLEAASDILNEYSNLRDGSTGALAANEYYVREMQHCAEEAATDLERMIQCAVDGVKNNELDKLCQEASTALRGDTKWKFTRQQVYYQALSEELAPRIQKELQKRLDAAVQTAQSRVLETAQRLLSEAGLMDESSKVQIRARDSVSTPTADHLKSRFPAESVMALSLTAGAAGTAAITEAGGALLAGLGLRIGAASVAGLVGVAVVSFATLGYTCQKAAEMSPCWRYATVEADVVSRVRQATQWGMLAEAASSRARAQLLSGVAHFRYNFSVVLLHKGTPRSVLQTLFPDLPLFEEIHRSLEHSAADVRAFADSQDLAATAGTQLVACREWVRVANWSHVVDATGLFVEPNARTDSIDGGTLASLLHLRCFALIMGDMFGEAQESSEVFRQTFPELLLPNLYRTAAHVRFEFLQGTLQRNEVAAAVRSCLQRLDVQHAEREVPRELEVWFLAVVLSWLELPEVRERLLSVVGCFMSDLMMGRPSKTHIAEQVASDLRTRLALVGKELSNDVTSYFQSPTSAADFLSNVTTSEDVWSAHREVEDKYNQACQAYALGLATSVHLLLSSLPPSHVDMDTVGRPLVDVLVQRIIAREFAKGPLDEQQLQAEVHAALCPVDGGHVRGVGEEWLQLIEESVRGAQEAITDKSTE